MSPFPTQARRAGVAASAALALGAGIAAAVPAAERPAPREVLVLYEQGARAADARAAIRAAGGAVVRENRAVGLATVRTRERAFDDRVVRAGAVAGVAPDRAIGRAPRTQYVAGMASARSAARPAAPLDPAAEPLSTVQWDMAMIDADRNGSHRLQQGSRDVLVGIIDSGIEATHPDVAPNLDARLSRNFTVDDPLIDGPCAEDPDGSCDDPVGVDENGHGTGMASIAGGALNGVGMGGVAPGARLVDLRAMQDSGFVFLRPAVDALTYAADHGVDVVNMSFYIDPWLYNCAANPADSPQEQAQQRTIIDATVRAMRYARSRGVTMATALGNGSQDKSDPQVDTSSPDYPPGNERERPVDDTCLDLPTEGPGALGVSALGPSGRKAFYSDWGRKEADLAAPGGDLLDFPGTSRFGAVENGVLSAVSAEGLRQYGQIDADGEPTAATVLRECGPEGACASWISSRAPRTRPRTWPAWPPSSWPSTEAATGATAG